jgi:hypothetical protein
MDMTVGELWRIAEEKAIPDSKLAKLTGITAISYYKKKPANYEIPEKFAKGIERVKNQPEPTEEDVELYKRHQKAAATYLRNKGETTTTKRSYKVAALKKTAKALRTRLSKRDLNDPSQAFAKLVEAVEARENLRTQAREKAQEFADAIIAKDEEIDALNRVVEMYQAKARNKTQPVRTTEEDVEETTHRNGFDHEHDSVHAN